MRRIAAVPALAFVLAIPLGGCESDRLTDVTDPSPDTDGAVLAMLSASGEWEATAHPVRLTDVMPEGPPPWSGDAVTAAASMAAAAERDLAWLAADGSRYEALYVHADGSTFGRRAGGRGVAPVPDAANGFGAFRGTAPGPTSCAWRKSASRSTSTPTAAAASALTRASRRTGRSTAAIACTAG